MYQLAELRKEMEFYLAGMDMPDDDRLYIIDDNTIERADYVVYFYSNEKFLRTNNFSDTIAGNAPVIFNKHTKELHVTGTADTTEYYIAEYEKLLKDRKRSL